LNPDGKQVLKAAAYVFELQLVQTKPIPMLSHQSVARDGRRIFIEPRHGPLYFASLLADVAPWGRHSGGREKVQLDAPAVLQAGMMEGSLVSLDFRRGLAGSNRDPLRPVGSSQVIPPRF